MANEFNYKGSDHRILKDPEGEVELMKLARQAAPGLLASTSGYGDGKPPAGVARASDFLLPHFNGTPVGAIPERIAALKPYNKPIVCNEDDKVGAAGARAAEACVANGASWGLILNTQQGQPVSAVHL